MRILIDGCVHSGVKAAFRGHAVRTVAETQWRSAKDGSLLSFAETQFDVFVTIDRKLEKQNTLTTFRLGFVVIRVPSSTLDSYLPIFPQLCEAAETVGPEKLSTCAIL